MCFFGAVGSVSVHLQHCEPNSGCKNLEKKYLQSGMNMTKICREKVTQNKINHAYDETTEWMKIRLASTIQGGKNEMLRKINKIKRCC